MAKKTKYELTVPPRFLYRYRPLHDQFSSVRQMLEHDHWWFGSRANFDDPEDLIAPAYDFEDVGLAERARQANQEFMDNTGVLCLSMSAKHPRLWKEYAADGKGVCIKLESDHVVHPDNGPFRVNYSDAPKPLWKPFQDNGKPLVHLLQKRRIWSYQGEWRCIWKWKPGEQPTVGYHSMWHSQALAGLVFGWDTTPEERAEVIDWLTNGRNKWLRRLGAAGQYQLTLQQARLIGGSVELVDYHHERTP